MCAKETPAEEAVCEETIEKEIGNRNRTVFW